jgi:sporadic carbohydrate cluster protein (TIGR04323 family)
MLSPTEKYWDNSILHFNTLKYNFKDWALSIVQELEPSIKKLEHLHLNVEPKRLAQIKSHFHKATIKREFMEMIDNFIKEYIPEKIENKNYLIQRYPTLRIVEPNQLKNNIRRLAFHKDTWVGSGKGLRTIWMPFTKCYSSNSLQILPLDISHNLSKQYNETWSLEKFENECLKYSFPVTLEYGKCHLFLQEHIHGNVNNDTEITRVSMDIRILIEGEPYHRRYPGGYLRFPGDYQSDITEDNSHKTFITYDGWNSTYSKNIPLSLQRYLIDDYCKKKKIFPVDDRLESEYIDWCPNLQSYIKEKPNGIVLLSIFSLPDNIERRNNILKLALENNVELHFANEYIVLKNYKDLQLIKKYIEFSPP